MQGADSYVENIETLLITEGPKFETFSRFLGIKKDEDNYSIEYVYVYIELCKMMKK